jgi:cysteine-rich repeat protein
MQRIGKFMRINHLGAPTLASLIALGALGALTGSCFFDTRTTLCERSGVRCPDGLVCAQNQAACIEPNGCGNGLPDPGEMCDDGNVMDGDGCSADCKSNETCGNGFRDTNTGESCDEGAMNGTALSSCNASCELVACGNGAMDVNEQCDPGANDSAGCNSSLAGEALRCKFSACGDGYVNHAAGEVCDTHGQDTAECNSLICTAPRCGDKYTNNEAGEDCDVGAAGNSGCNGNANMDGAGNCKVPRCGDGYLNNKFTPPGAGSPEECDDGNDKDNDFCLSSPQGQCRLAFCGDNVVRTVGDANNPAEECDKGSSNSNTTKDACRTNCKRAFCGDGVKDSGEVCDKAGVGDQTCDNGKICSDDCKTCDAPTE